MVALSSNAGFVDVTRVETSDVALGGNEVNTPNKQFVECASRDAALLERIQAIQGTDATAQQSFARSKDLAMASIAQGRLTLATGDATPSADQTAATTLYYTPYNGDLISLWNGSGWTVHQFTERSLSLSGLAANANYDIFLWDNSGTLTLQAVGWSSSGAGSSARASAISRRNGVWVKTTDNRRYLGTIRTTATIGQCEDSNSRRFAWNAQNRVPRSTYAEFLPDYAFNGGTRPVGNNIANTLTEAVFGLENNQVDFKVSAEVSSGRTTYRIQASADGAVLGRLSYAWDAYFAADNFTFGSGYHQFYTSEQTGGTVSILTHRNALSFMA